MMKSWKRLLCMMLAGVMLFSTGVVTQAAPAQNTEIDSIEGLDQYLSKNQDGTIILDEFAAQDAGYTEEAIAYVQENISYMNDMVRTKGAYIDDQFKMIYSESPMTRARGVNKVEMLWNGNVAIYMDSDAAQEYIDAMLAIGDGMESVGDILDDFSFIQGAGVLAMFPFLYSIQARFYAIAASNAAAAGNGIILLIQRDYFTQTDTLSFLPQ